MNQENFQSALRAGYNSVPVFRQVLADVDTPLSTYLKLAAQPYSFLLESVQGGEKWGRYSMIGLPSDTRIKVSGHQVTLERDGEIEHWQVEDPLAWIDEYQTQFRVAPADGLPRFSGGLVGYFGYDTIRYVEPRLGPNTKPDPIGVPDILLMLAEEVVVFDNLSGSLYAIVHAHAEGPKTLAWAEARLDQLIEQLEQPLKEYPQSLPVSGLTDAHSNFNASFTQQGFEDAVERVKRYIVDGDVMQVVPSQRMSIDFTAPPIDLYRALRYLNPSPYMFHLQLDDFAVVGASPEVLTRLEDGVLTVRPIAGTRPRGQDTEQDLLYERELMEDPKELAEHLMLIDLGRNDVGRVAEIGSVEVTETMVVERYSHVMHIVSNVEGKVRDGMTAIDALRATFPAGTLTGAPKVRAMEIIDELEPVKRGVYSGAVGYIGWSGNMDTAIAIRTAVIKDDTLHVQAGGGIVADSVPATEWEETLNKRRALFRAVAMVEAGLKSDPAVEQERG
ncbi:MAG: anthranilate synthase component I [Gammaproteobacteria bacterium]|nr:MAG: anthranilate synthase component I [Gammaproteobacteria bacterium]RLA16088.1 MAG: anthranilate synthase component I [Gammaproteobacteria bacterium]RLA18048.1 MAG: anthranilate synthase component I [Gammaproteobacteria bacterium]